MKRETQGRFETCFMPTESYRAFVPIPLPPEPPVEIGAFSALLDQANRSIGELNGVVDTASDPSLLTYMYVRREAVLSSQIEGTQSTLDDLMKYESEHAVGVPVPEAEEVSTYVAALNHGLKRLHEGFPLSLRLVREVHEILLKHSRGYNKRPGIFRESQNWIGGSRPGNARFVPPPPHMLMECLGAWETFMNEQDESIPTLVRAALLHVQFETIHPFLDGNGRVGRLLITLYLCASGILRSPLFYPSLFFKKNRSLYYEALNAVRKDGDWEAWVSFFLEGVIEAARDAKDTLVTAQRIFIKGYEKIATLKRAAGSAGIVFREFCRKPLLTIAEITRETGLSKPTVIKSVRHLLDIGLVANNSTRKWGQIYTFTRYAELISRDTEPL